MDALRDVEEQKRLVLEWSKHWTRTERSEFIDFITTKLSRRFDMLSELPEELAMRILSHLDIGSLGVCALVSRQWHVMVGQREVWRRVLEGRGWWHPALQLARNGVDSPRAGVVAVAGTERTEGDSFLKNVMKERLALDRNWRAGRARISVLRGHEHSVYCLQLRGNTLVSGSKDMTMRVWDMATGQCTHTLRGHTASVLCLQYEERVIVSGSSDKTIKIWDTETYSCVYTITGHDDAVLHLKADEKRIAAINMVQYNEQVVVCASGDRTLWVWDMATGAHLHRLDGHKNGVACFHLTDKYIVSGASDRTVIVWSVRTGQALAVIPGSVSTNDDGLGHLDLIRCLHVTDDFLITGSYDRKIKVWDWRRIQQSIRDRKIKKDSELGGVKLWGEHSPLVTTLDYVQANNDPNGHSSRVYKLCCDKDKMVTGAQGPDILIWDFTPVPTPTTPNGAAQ